MGWRKESFEVSLCSPDVKINARRIEPIPCFLGMAYPPCFSSWSRSGSKYKEKKDQTVMVALADTLGELASWAMSLVRDLGFPGPLLVSGTPLRA